MPLFIALLAIRFDPEERATGRRLVGLVVGLTGVVVLMGIDVAGEADELLGALAILIAAFGYAVGPMLLKAKLSALDPRAMMGASLLLAAIVLTPFAAIAPPEESPSGDVIASLLVLGIVCTALAFVIFGALINDIGPGRALVITYVNPVVAVVPRRADPGRAAGHRRRRRAAADPRRLVALDRRPPAARPRAPLQSPAIRRSKPAGA